MTTLHEAAQKAIYWLDQNGGAHIADELREALEQQEEPVTWPQTPEQVRDFIGSDFVWREGNDAAPEDGDKYCVTAHDLLSAFREWPEFAAAPAAQGCDYCNSSLFAGRKCKNCGRGI